MNIYKCKHCGNIVVSIKDTNGSLACCLKDMELLIPGSIEAATEKHIPVVQKQDQLVVTVGETEHPMTKEHSIEWILVELENGFMMKHLNQTGHPMASFQVEEPVKAVYTYCNIHGLWKAEL